MKFLVLLTICNVFATKPDCYQLVGQQSFLGNFYNGPEINAIAFKKRKVCKYEFYKSYRDAFLNRMTLFVENTTYVDNDICLLRLLQVDQETGNRISMLFARVGGPYYALEPRCIKGLHPNNSTRKLAMNISKRIYKYLKNNFNNSDISTIREIKAAAIALNKQGKGLIFNK